MNQKLPILAFLALMAAPVVAQEPQHRTATSHSSPPLAFVGQTVQVQCALFNLDDFGDTHWWTRATVEFRRNDESVTTGNLLTNGAIVTLYLSNVVQRSQTITNGMVELPSGWSALVSVSYVARPEDVGVMASYGTCEGWDLHDAMPDGLPNLLGGTIGSLTEIRPLQLLLAFADRRIDVEFIQPAGLNLRLETSTDYKSWVDMEAFPASKVTRAVARSYQTDEPQRFFRLCQAAPVTPSKPRVVSQRVSLRPQRLKETPKSSPARSKAPNTKLQAPKKLQTPRSNIDP